jgi:hypothetical protein
MRVALLLLAIMGSTTACDPPAGCPAYASIRQPSVSAANFNVSEITGTWSFPFDPDATLVHSCWKSSIAMILLAIAATESLLRGTHVFSRASLIGLPKVYDCNQRAHNAFDVQMSREQLHRRRAS